MLCLHGRQDNTPPKGAGCIERASAKSHLSQEKAAATLLAVRKPKGYKVIQPGELVQLDTLDIRPLPGVVVKHFTAHDVISRWNVLSVYSRATATTGAHFLDTLEGRMSFPVKAIQVDGGSEFETIFEEECQRAWY